MAQRTAAMTSPAVLLFLLLSAASPRSVEPAFANNALLQATKTPTGRRRRRQRAGGALPEICSRHMPAPQAVPLLTSRLCWDDEVGGEQNQRTRQRQRQQPPPDNGLTRRGALQRTISRFASASAVAAAAAAPPSLLLPRNACAASSASTPSPRAAAAVAHPPIEYLEPLQELRLSVNALADLDAADPKRWPRMLKRLNNFFSSVGTTMSERDVYVKIGEEYVNMIRYGDGTADEVAERDRTERMAALVGTLDSLDSLRGALEETLVGGRSSGGGSAAATTTAEEDVTRNARDARRSLSDFFGRIPTADVRAVEALVRDVNEADADRDGRLSSSEMERLPTAEEREVWERRVERYGRTKVEKTLGFKIGHTNFV